MAKKAATYSTYDLRVEDNGKIVILNDSQPVQNTMGAIRTIAAEVGFTIDPKWNTQSSGRKLVDFLNSVPTTATPAPKADTKPAPEYKPVSETKPTTDTVTAPKPEAKHVSRPVTKAEQTVKDNELTEEEMDELLKQISDLRKAIHGLESRMAKMENNPGEATANDRLYVMKEISRGDYLYQRDRDGSLVLRSYYSINQKDKRDEVYAEILQGNFESYQKGWIPRLLMLSNGEIISISGRLTNNSGDATVRETKAFALQMGIEASDKASMVSLAATIMAQYGRNGWCVGNGTLMNGEGCTYSYTVVDFATVMHDCVGRIGLIEQLPVPDITGKSPEEKLRIATDYISRVFSYPMPTKEKVIEDFKKACEEYDKFGK